MASLDVYTYQDAVDHVIDVFSADRRTQPKRIALRAVQRAYDKFADLHRWTYFERRSSSIHTVASQSTGSVTYDHEGGTYPRQLTIAGATWPDVDDLRIYKVILDSQQYDIEDRKSDTVVTLTSTSNPGSDLAAGSSYTLFKSRYLLPINFRKMITRLINLPQSETLKHVTPGQLLERLRGDWQPSDPSVFTIYNAGEYYGGWLVELAPPPNIAETWDFMYDAKPRPLRYERYNTGTVTTDGTTTVAGSGTSFSSNMIGSMLRVPISGSTEPGGIVGSIDVSGNEVDRFDAQRTITAVNSTIEIVVDSPISARSGVGFTISDPIDMEPGTMTHAFLALCEAEFAMMNRRKDWKDLRAYAMDSIREAMSADNREREIDPCESSSNKELWSLAEWALAEDLKGAALT